MTYFHRKMTDQDREHCRLDLHKAQDGEMPGDVFVAKWGAALEGYFADLENAI